MDDRRMRVARKVAHLRRLGVDPNSTNEAAAARALADQLVARYGLTPVELAAGERAAYGQYARPMQPPVPVQRVVVYVVRGCGWGFSPSVGFGSTASGTTTVTGMGSGGWWPMV